jgi:LmbE family N-acetylglucosaminyl deacetylase
MIEQINEEVIVLAFFAHPDDETVFLGGTFAYLADRGVKVHFLCATRGEGGELGNPPVCARENLGITREGELQGAVQALGGKSIQFLDYQDPLVGPEGELFTFTNNPEELAGKVTTEIRRINPDVIISHGPGGEYGHPAHIQAHDGLIKALSTAQLFSPIVYAPSYFSRETGRFSPEPDFVVDISAWKDQKVEAFLSHKSQHDLFLRHGSARAGRKITIPEMVRTKEALTRIHPPGLNNIPDPLAKLLTDISIPDISL